MYTYYLRPNTYTFLLYTLNKIKTPIKLIQYEIESIRDVTKSWRDGATIVLLL